MKKKNIYMIVLLFTTLLNLSAQETADLVEVVCKEALQRGDSLYVEALITVKSEALKTRKSLELVPVVTNESRKAGMLPVLLNGRIRDKVYNREIALGNLQPVPYYTVLKVVGETEQTIRYNSAIGWEDWMKDARILLSADLCGCGGQETSDLLIADKIRRRPDKRYEVVPAFAYITPQAETEKHRAEVGSAYLDFQVGRSQILPDFRNNRSELKKIDETIQTVLSDKNITPQGIVLKGYASPEGSYASNDRLSENRVKALCDYIRRQHNFKEDFFVLDNEPEDWDGFKVKTEADANIPDRDAVLEIINSSDEPDRKESDLRSLNGGVAYRYVLENIFPSLRRSEYRINYIVRSFSVEEGREVIKTHPEQLSLSEMFAVANSYPVASDEYNSVFDIAVRLYPEDEIANLNAANIAMGKGDYSSARHYLSKAGETPEAIHARGVLNLLEGNLEEALVLLKKAKEMGVSEAASNLEELERKNADNALFDSFN